MSDQWEPLRKYILAFMKETDVNKAELARRLGWPSSHVSRTLGSDEKPGEPTPEPGLNKLTEIATALNTTLPDMLLKSGAAGKRVHAAGIAPTRDSLLARFIELAVKMSVKELESGVSIVEKMMASRDAKAKKDSKSESYAG